MTNKRDENDLLKAGKLQSDPLHGADRAALRVVQPGEEHRTDLPSSIESERALLAALLWAGKNQPDMLRIGAVRDILDDGGVFYRWQHGRIYGAMIACAESKQEHDPVAVHAQIASSGQSMGGREALEKLVDIASTVSERQARVYAQAIRDSWVRRKIIADAEQVAREARDPKVSTVDLIDRSKAVYAAAAERASINGSSVSLRESAESLFRRLQAATQDWCPTGFVDLDGLLNGGLRPREVSVLAARTSVGKSMLACQIAERIVTDDPSRGVLYVSLEMDHEMFTARLLSARAGVPLKAIRRLELGPYWSAITGVVGEMANKGLYFADTPSQTMATVFRAALDRKRLLEREGKRLVAVVVDHLGLVKPTAEALKRATREQQVAETSRSLRFLASELGLHVMALAQIGRDAAKTGEVPKIHQLRETGAIEQDADQILILHRERTATGTFNNDKPPGLVFAKGRMDETGAVLLGLDPMRMRFGDFTGNESFGDVYD